MVGFVNKSTGEFYPVKSEKGAKALLADLNNGVLKGNPEDFIEVNEGETPEGAIKRANGIYEERSPSTSTSSSVKENEEFKPNIRSGSANEKRYNALGDEARYFPRVADELMRTGDWSLVNAALDMSSLPGRKLDQEISGVDMGETGEEAGGLIHGIARSPYTLPSAYASRFIGGAAAALPWVGRATAQGLLGGATAVAEGQTRLGEDKSDSKILDFILGFGAGFGGEALSTGVREAVSRFGKESVRRVLEGLQFGALNGKRSIDGRDIGKILENADVKKILKEAQSDIARFGNRTSKLERGVEDADKEFLSVAHQNNTPSSVKGAVDAEYETLMKGASGLSKDAESTALNEDLLFTARTKPWDKSAQAARQVVFNDERRVPWKMYVYNKGGFTGGLQQSGKLTGYTKSNGALPARISKQDGEFLDELAKYFDLSAKGTGDRFGDINIKGERYSANAAGVGKMLFDKYFSVLQEAAISTNGITPEKLLDVMKYAAKQNDDDSIKQILHAAQKLGFNEEQEKTLFELAKKSGMYQKLIELIKSGKDISKYDGNLPVNFNLINAKGLNPMAGVSRFGGLINGIADRTSVRDANLNVVREGVGEKVMPTIRSYLYGSMYPATQEVKKSVSGK